MLNIWSILEIDGACSGTVFLLQSGPRLTGDLFLWPFGSGIGLVAMGTPFLPFSLPLYFSFLGEGEILVTSCINIQFI